jgi:hypothetical protein
MKRGIAVILIFVAVSVLSFVGYNAWMFAHMNPVERMQKLWDDDMRTLEDGHALPKGWSLIKEIELSPGSDQSKDWLKKLEVPVVLNKNGQFRLQILFLPWEENGKIGAFLQYDLVDLKSEKQNTVWETSRTLIISDKKDWVSKFLH